MPLPAEDVALVQQFVDSLNADLPPHVSSQLRYRLDTLRNAVTLVESRAVEPAKPSGDWFDVVVARMRFTRSRGWELYWADRNSDLHVYDLIDPTLDVTVLIDEIQRDPTCIFFG